MPGTARASVRRLRARHPPRPKSSTSSISRPGGAYRPHLGCARRRRLSAACWRAAGPASRRSSRCRTAGSVASKRRCGGSHRRAGSAGRGRRGPQQGAPLSRALARRSIGLARADAALPGLHGRAMRPEVAVFLGLLALRGLAVQLRAGRVRRRGEGPEPAWLVPRRPPALHAPARAHRARGAAAAPRGLLTCRNG